MNKFEKLFCVIINRIRYFFLGFFASVDIALITFISLKCELRIRKGGKIRLRRYSQIWERTVISIAENAIVRIGENSFINRNCCIVAHKEISIGDNVAIGPNCYIYDHNHDIYKRGSYISKRIEIQSGVWIGAGCIILPGVIIGENSVIAAGSVVSKNVPANTMLIQKRDNTYQKIRDDKNVQSNSNDVNI